MNAIPSPALSAEAVSATAYKPRTDFDAFISDADGANRIELAVKGAKCGGCISKIENALNGLAGVESARLNLSTGQLRVHWHGEMTANTVAQTVSDLGYEVSPHRVDTIEKERRKEERSLLIAMGVAGFAAANIMLLSVSVWGGSNEMGESTRRIFHIISGLIAFPVVLFSGHVFFRSAWTALRNRSVNMDVPISLAVWLAFLTSVWETAIGGPHAYFDACAMLLFFLLIGRFLDARLRRRAYAAAHQLAAMRNHSVTRLGPQGAEAVLADQIGAGDRILVAPGERVVVDMRVLKGMSEIDESLVTGESLPVTIAEGRTLYSGTVNLGAPLEGEALAASGDSLLAEIAAMLEAGEQRRSSYRKIADKAVSLYVPFVHITALLAFTGWIVAGAGVRDAILVAVSTLIITCPCALALAGPVAQMVAANRLFGAGVFLKSGDALERLAEIDHIVFDKTGTLTFGVPKWRETPEGRKVLNEAAMLARASRHPLSRALANAAGPGPVADNIIEHPGLGLIADIDGVPHRIGSADWVGCTATPSLDGPVIWHAAGDTAPIALLFDDDARDNARDELRTLKENGYSLEVLSGDKEASVARAAIKLDIGTWTAEASPASKAERLETLKQQGRKVLMVGDGLNDAPALSLAHAALAPGGAIDVSQSAADAVYPGELSAIGAILDTAKSAKRTMLQNYGLAAGYNLIAVPIAVTGHATPLVAAIAMSASSLIVTLNAIRMGRRRAQ